MPTTTPLDPADYIWKITRPEAGVSATTNWMDISIHRGRVRGVVTGTALDGFTARITTVRGKEVHAITGVFSRLSEAQESIEAWLNRHDAKTSLPAGRHVWGVISSRGAVEVHQCQHRSCGKFRVIGGGSDEARLYTSRQLMAAYPDLEWD